MSRLRARHTSHFAPPPGDNADAVLLVVLLTLVALVALAFAHTLWTS